MRYVAAVLFVVFFCITTVRGSLCYLRFSLFTVSQCEPVSPCSQPDLSSCYGCGYEFPPEKMSGCCPVDPAVEAQEPVVIICTVCILSEDAYTDRCDLNQPSPRLLSTLFERRLATPEESSDAEHSWPSLKKKPSRDIPSPDGRPWGVHLTIATTVVRS
ncbi:MAG: hypothetical protein OEV49_12615 [candidate division Zixibacteria bacterium]|nr:hypothetical protein [candidate division Zixibacteria bacterium]MDH3936978.1 hypothetical protein [candidate division Zixibacteria bacterium]MDH4032799.1 hypothetical protein [candidate division Zixibacteria bacterium]